MPGPKREIDSGQYVAKTNRGLTHDKVDAPDPAAAPVHTDAEAAGRPTPAQASHAATREQMESVPRLRDHTNYHLLGLLAATAVLVIIGLTLTLLTPVRF